MNGILYCGTTVFLIFSQKQSIRVAVRASIETGVPDEYLSYENRSMSNIY